MSEEIDKAANEFLKNMKFEGLSVEGVGLGKDGGTEGITLQVDHAIDSALLQRAIEANEVGTAVLLWNLEIEHQLRLFLKAHSGLSAREANNYNALVLMLKACRFENDIYPVVNNFRKLRNKFAHEKDASLEKHKSILDAIFACEPPSPAEDKIDVISDGKNSARLEELTSFSRLSVYANFAVIFLASANKIYSFPKPVKRIVISTTKSTGNEGGE